MPVLTEPPSMGDVLKYEVNPNYTREVITLLIGTSYPSGAVLGRITASGVDATVADATGIIVARGPTIVSRAGLAYEGTVNDATKITAKIGQLAAVGIIARDGV